MAAYLERDDFVYPSNLDDSDFEGTVRSSRDVTSEIFDPPPPVPFSSDLETEIYNNNLFSLSYKYIQVCCHM